MASKQTYECFVCKSNGYPGVLVYLAGKDDQGRAIRLEDDGVTPHTHKTKVPSQQHQQQHTQQQQQQIHQEQKTVDLLLEVKLMHQKIDKILNLLSQQQQNAKEKDAS